nr:MAG TPA: hypothetical protein [Caudoviricetes sp.]
MNVLFHFFHQPINRAIFKHLFVNGLENGIQVVFCHINSSFLQ